MELLTVLPPLIALICGLLEETGAFHYCSTSTPRANSTVQFVHARDLPPEVNGCVEEILQFQCCMTGYSAVRWFQQRKDGVWVDFLHTTQNRRLGEDDHQTAILERPFAGGYDEGKYRCVGYGTTPGDSINHTLVLKLRECPDLKNSAPFPFVPENNETREVALFTNVTIPCGAIFGRNCDDFKCKFHWEKLSQHCQTIPEGNDTCGLRIYYETRAAGSDVNDIISRLYILSFSKSDYGTYVCTMENSVGNSTRTIFLTVPETVEKLLLQRIAVGLGCVCLVFLIFGGISYWRRWELYLRWNELKEKVKPDHQAMDYDILLLHTSSVNIDQRFSRYCDEKLQLFRYKVATVEDITDGRDIISEWLHKSKSSRSVLVILSPDFLTDKDQICRLPLRNIICTKANVSFVLFHVSLQTRTGSFFNESTLVFKNHHEAPRSEVLCGDLCAALRFKTKIQWPEDIDTRRFLGESGELNRDAMEQQHKEQLKDFWKEVVNNLQLKCDAQLHKNEKTPLLQNV